MVSIMESIYTAAGDENYEQVRDNLIPVGSFCGVSEECVKKILRRVATEGGKELGEVLQLLKDSRQILSSCY